ncbi:MAG: hypothetical protein JWM57_2666 [Phycisphaerales bacterium]|nr:hypothetical protein [Phycisphaerales bacterium]
MLRWLERFATLIVLLLVVGVLLACWMPAYVGTSDGEPRRTVRMLRGGMPRNAR